MKKIFISIFIISIFISCDKNRPDLVINARLVSTYDSTYTDSTSNKVCKVDFTLTNNSKNELCFWTMSCSWIDSWIINAPNYNFLFRGCDNNFPVVEKIKPNDSLVYHSIIVANDSKFRNFDSTCFGLIFLDTITCKTSADYIKVLGDRSKQNNIIWSNPLTLLENIK